MEVLSIIATHPLYDNNIILTHILDPGATQEAKEGTYKEIYKGINRRKNLNVNEYEDGLKMAKQGRYAYIAEKSY